MKYLLAIALSAFCVAGTADELDQTTDLPEAAVLLLEDTEPTEAPVASDEETTEEEVVTTDEESTDEVVTLAEDQGEPEVYLAATEEEEAEEVVLLIALNDELNKDMDIEEVYNTDCEDGQCPEFYI